MNSLIIFCTMLGVAFSAPSIYQTIPMAPSASKTYMMTAGVRPMDIQAPAMMDTTDRPLITGTLQVSQDTQGNYKYGYTSSDGQSKTEERQGDKVTGAFSFLAPEGNRFNLNYIADKEGFRPEGEHLPEVPELPEVLAAAYREAHERLAQAYEEARLRGDDEDSSEEEGAYKPELYELPYEEATSTQATVAYSNYQAQVPIAMKISKPIQVSHKIHVAKAKVPADNQATIYQTYPTSAMDSNREKNLWA